MSNLSLTSKYITTSSKSARIQLQPRKHLFTTSSHISAQNQGMASSDPSKHNNADFQLQEVFNVKDKVAVITGGGSGIGLMATQALAVNGAKVGFMSYGSKRLPDRS